MAEPVLAAVRTEPGRTEMREFPMPEISDDAALLKIEVAGICGTDVNLYRKPTIDEPVIMGHGNIGIVAKAGAKWSQIHGSHGGDGISVEHYVGCMNCEWCRAGEYRHCDLTDWHVLETFLGYRDEQGLSRRRYAPEELFAPEATEASVI